MEIDKILVLDDEMIIRRTMQEYCHRKRIKVKAVGTLREAMEVLEGDHGFDVMFLDINLPDGEGTEVLEAMENKSNSPLAIMITGQGTIESAVKCMQLGAYDYIQKPFATEEIDLVLKRADKFNHLVQVNRELSAENAGEWIPFIGNADNITRLKDLISCVSMTDATVMIDGETGTGKEIIAQAIHQGSLRKDRPFIKVNCAAISETLIESEFFGHEKGAFTGAMQSRIGRFELADKGTILLDEVSEISLPLQAKLLRVLQEKELERVGGTKTIKVDVRIIATTNRDLNKSIAAGKFRQDLYYRLNVFPLHSPPLRERKSDIPILARHFLRGFSRKHGRSLKDFTPQVYKLLERYDWPGNVRELQNTVERSVILATRGALVDASILPLEIQVLPDFPEEDAPPSDLPARPVEPLPDLESFLPEKADDLPVMLGPPGSDEDWTLEAMERQLILRTLKRTEGNRTKAAEIMKISIRTLFNKLNQYKKKGFNEFEPYFNS